ncbi:Amino-acid acetyltransferase, mitochondrial [Mycoemilia scoparia]|uniref:Amino-acid acetyltransferase, mitochondrial n=1 Tax=Mycoemilia scoparia TaxID=417184 RepID=A0A9W8A2E8_9FUNG|nr:Amino-acid acetyltransferase, mitochondrial [Mycoemilia scoparia]
MSQFFYVKSKAIRWHSLGAIRLTNSHITSILEQNHCYSKYSAGFCKGNSVLSPTSSSGYILNANIHGRRSFSITAKPDPATNSTTASETTTSTNNLDIKHKVLSNRDKNERELILSVMSSAPSPHEARQFLKRVVGTINPATTASSPHTLHNVTKTNTNLANMPNAVLRPSPKKDVNEKEESSTISTVTTARATEIQQPQKLLVSLVHIEMPNEKLVYGTDEFTKIGQHLGKLLAQMQRLGVLPIVVISLPHLQTFSSNLTTTITTAVDNSVNMVSNPSNSDCYTHYEAIQLLHSLTDNIEQAGGRAYPIIDGVFVPNDKASFNVLSVKLDSIQAVANGNNEQQRIPLILPIAVDEQSKLSGILDGVTATTALAQALSTSGQVSLSKVERRGDSSSSDQQRQQQGVCYEPIRFIYLSELGQLPKLTSTNADFSTVGVRRHRFINLEEEFEKMSKLYTDLKLTSTTTVTNTVLSPLLVSRRPQISRQSSTGAQQQQKKAKTTSDQVVDIDGIIIDNADRALQLCRACLGLFPATAAGVVASLNSDPALIIKGIISERPIANPGKSILSGRDISNRCDNESKMALELDQPGISDNGGGISGCGHESEQLSLLSGLLLGIPRYPEFELKNISFDKTNKSGCGLSDIYETLDSGENGSGLVGSGIPSYQPILDFPYANVGTTSIGDAFFNKGTTNVTRLGNRNSWQQQQQTCPTQFTLLRHGYKVHHFNSLDQCDPVKLKSLLEVSFGRTLKTSEYFDRLAKCRQDYMNSCGNGDGLAIIVTGDYMGAVIVTLERIRLNSSTTTGDEYGYIPYLDKFAVDPRAQGTGLADILWSQLQHQFPAFAWRSRDSNKVNKWYFERCTGHWRAPPPPPESQGSVTRWVCFWYEGYIFNADNNNNLSIDEAIRDYKSSYYCQHLPSIVEMIESIPASF